MNFSFGCSSSWQCGRLQCNFNFCWFFLCWHNSIQTSFNIPRFKCVSFLKQLFIIFSLYYNLQNLQLFRQYGVSVNNKISIMAMCVPLIAGFCSHTLMLILFYCNHHKFSAGCHIKAHLKWPWKFYYIQCVLKVLISNRLQAFTMIHRWYPSCFGVITVSVQMIGMLKFL